MAWAEVKSQILNCMCSQVNPDEVKNLVKQIDFQNSLYPSHSKELVSDPKTLWDQECFYPAAVKCFFQAFKTYLEITYERSLFGTKDIRIISGCNMRKLEDGLFVDFLLASICTLQEWRCKGAQDEYTPRNLAYPRLLEAWKNKQHLLHGGLFVECDRSGRKRPNRGIRASLADRIQIEYFYVHDYQTPFPTYRRSNANKETMFNFLSVSQPFNILNGVDEFWRNFYTRELHWGTNLAALLSQYAEKFAPAGLEKISSQVWEHCTSKSTVLPCLIDQLMALAAPAYRISFVKGILKHALNQDEGYMDLDDGWYKAIDAQDLGQILTSLTSVQKMNAYIADSQFRALALLIAVWNSMGSHSPQYTSEELEQYFSSFLEDSSSISSFIDCLCYAVKKALEDLFDLPIYNGPPTPGVPAAYNLSKLEERWPLLLISNHNDKHIQKLMTNRETKTSPRDEHTKAFAEILSRTHH